MKTHISRQSTATDQLYPVQGYAPNARPSGTTNDRYHASFDLAPIGLAHVAPDGTWQAVNQRFCEMLGYAADELLGLRFQELTYGDDLAEDIGYLDKMLAGEVETYSMDKRYVRKNGDLLWAHVTSNLVWDEDRDSPLYFITAIEDIGPRKQAEQDLRQSKEDLRFSVTAAQLGTFYCDWPLDKIIWNDTCKEHFFLPPDAEIDFEVFYSRLHPDDREPTRAAIAKAAEQHAEYDVEYRTLSPDGKTRWINAVGRFLYAPDGTPMRFDGITIDISARKEAQLERMAQASREALINRIGVALRNSTDPTTIQATAVKLLGEALDADRCYFAVYDLSHAEVTVEAEWRRAGLPAIKGVHRFPNTREMYAELFRGKNASIVRDAFDAGLSTQTVANMRSLQLRSRISVSVAETTGVMANLTAAMAEQPREWAPDEMQLVRAVAVQMRAAVEIAQVRQREHRIATDLQAALQPEVPENVPGLDITSVTKAALDEAAIGGDFYDVFPLGNQQYACVIGDVSGKGLAAAAQLATVRNMLRGFLYQYRSPAQSVEILNRTLTGNDLLNGFVTVLVAVIDCETGEFTYSSCGHEPALLRRAFGSVETLRFGSPPLGVSDTAIYEDFHDRFRKGDTLFLYTDGMSEAGPSRRELLGTERLAEYLAGAPVHLGAQETAHWLVDKASAFANAAFHDDVCVIVARRTSD